MRSRKALKELNPGCCSYINVVHIFVTDNAYISYRNNLELLRSDIDRSYERIDSIHIRIDINHINESIDSIKILSIYIYYHRGSLYFTSNIYIHKVVGTCNLVRFNFL